MVLRFVDGRTFTEADLAANIGRIVPLLGSCHAEVGQLCADRRMPSGSST